MGNANPPFATADGKSTSKGASGSVDFVTDATAGASGGGTQLEEVLQNRPQPAYKAQVGLPNTASIPAGGKDLKADPGPVSQKVSGTAMPIGKVPRPFKGLR
jgi:hypothetical protein